MEKQFTAEDFRAVLDFDPVSGILMWREGSRRAGKEAGTKKASGYVVVVAFGRGWSAHRLAWLIVSGSWPDHEIDHIDGNRSNNSAHNLRQVSTSENRKNAAIPSHNTSGVAGVTWNKACGKWQAQIQVGGRSIYLGLFDQIDAASAARKIAADKYGFHRNHGRAAP